MTVFIIHGSFGNPKGNWFPWLKEVLQAKEYDVYVPAFPVEDYAAFTEKLKKDPQSKANKQNLKNWMKTFEKYIPKVDEDTIFVAHSIGPVFVLRVLERIDVQVRGCIFVSPFLGRIGIDEFDAVNSTFVDPPLSWSKVRQNCKRFYVISSDDDPYVPVELFEDFAQSVGVQREIIKGGKHLNAESGYTTFPRLVKITDELLDVGK